MLLSEAELDELYSQVSKEQVEIPAKSETIINYDSYYCQKHLMCFQFQNVRLCRQIRGVRQTSEQKSRISWNQSPPIA